MISKLPNYTKINTNSNSPQQPSPQLEQPLKQDSNAYKIKQDNKNSYSYSNSNNDQRKLKGRIEGEGNYNNLPSILPNNRPHFNYNHEEFETKPKNYIDKIIKEIDNKIEDRKQNNNYYPSYVNKARSMNNYLTPFSFTSFSDKKTIPITLSYKDQYQLKESNNGILNSFFNRNYTNLSSLSQILPSNKTLRHSSSCQSYSNYTLGIISLNKNKEEDSPNAVIDEDKKNMSSSKNTVLPSPFSSNNNPAYIKKSFNDKFHSVLNLSSISEYSFRQYHNEKYNISFDQRELFIDKVGDMPYECIIGLFDGHNGSIIVDYCKERFPIIFQRHLDYNPQTVYPYHNPKTEPVVNKTKRGLRTSTETLLVKSFQKLEKEIKYANKPNEGCCASVLYITKEMEKILGVSSIRKFVYCANIGDVQCWLLTKHSVRVLSTLHDTDNSLEIKRLRETGGVLYHDPVFGQLQFTRSFGHSDLKAYGITSMPDVKKYLVDDLRDKYIVIGTKEVFKYLKEEDILFYSQGNYIKTEEIVNKIINHAIMNGTKSNLSCFVIKL